jgi:hypothetical protein
LTTTDLRPDTSTNLATKTKSTRKPSFDRPFGDQISSKLTDTWRNNHNVALKIAPQKRLAQFQRQVAATESRGALPYRTKAGEQRREKNRIASATALVANVKLAEQGHGRNQVGELLLHQGASAQHSSSTAAYLLKDEDEPVDFQCGTAQRIAASEEDVADSWDD